MFVDKCTGAATMPKDSNTSADLKVTAVLKGAFALNEVAVEIHREH